MADLLFVTRWTPHPQGSGVQQRAFHFLRTLSTGFEIFLLITGDREDPLPEVLDSCRQIERLPRTKWDDLQYVWQMGRWWLAGVGPAWTLPLPEDWLSATRKRLNFMKKLFPERSFEVIHGHRFNTAPYAWAFHEQRPATLLQIDLDEVESRTRFRIVRSLPDSGLAGTSRRMEADARRCQEMERYWLPRFQRIFVSSQLEAGYLKRKSLRSEICLVPNIVDSPPSPQPLKPSGPIFTFLFVGTFGYLPNRDGVIFFLEEVWPQLWEKTRGNVRALVVGRGMPENFRTRVSRHPGTRVIGEVSDLAPWYGEADAVVVPLRAGGGTRIKILEAFAHGRPVVSTTVGAEGLEVKDGVHLLIADSPEEISRNCLRLLQEENLASNLTGNAAQLVREGYSPAVLKKILLSREERFPAPMEGKDGLASRIPHSR